MALRVGVAGGRGVEVGVGVGQEAFDLALTRPGPGDAAVPDPTAPQEHP